MGLLSLDIMSLEVLKRGGKPHEQRYSRRILHLVKKHHLLLVTLLLANAVAVESMPIFLSKITTEVVAVVVSVTAVLVFGEPRATEHVVRRRGRFCELYASERRHSGM
jgi:ankyrin repeat/SOCS box protein 13/metal transporter CNNM